MVEVLITRAAEDDYTQSLEWYAERSPRAADGFEAEATADRLLIVAVAHTSRRPGYWSER